MIDTWNITIPQLSGDQSRRAYVYLPDWYDDDQESRFPVLYMFDGQNVFYDEDATYGKSWGLGEFLEYGDVPLIVVAVECNDGEDNARLSEYSPYDFDDPKYGAFEGKGDQMLHWMVGTLKSQIDDMFRTLPERETTFIAGSSMGGLMSLYAVLQYNDVFSRAACLSPSVWVAPEKLTQLASTAEVDEDTAVYMDFGTEECAGNEKAIAGFASVSSALMVRGIPLTARVVAGGDHSEASWERQIPYFMDVLMDGLEEDYEED